MANKRETLGHIDCPGCGTAAGVRITHDKNGEPFGFCEAECNLQIRFGGNARRVALFVARYPWAAKPQPAPVSVREPEPAQQARPAPAAKPAPVVKQEPQPAAKPAPKRAVFDLGL